MANTITRQSIDAPVLLGPRYSLLIAAPVETHTAEGFAPFAYGFKFSPEICDGSSIRSMNCFSLKTAISPGTRGAFVEGDPIVVGASEFSSTFGYMAQDYQARVRRALDAQKSKVIALELWEGATTLADTLANRPLIDTASDVLTNGAVAPLNALALVEQGLGPSAGMVHVTPQVLAMLAGTQVIMKDGNLWRSPMGHIVVADAGYTGKGPQGTAPTSTQWMYGTSMIYIHLGPISLTSQLTAEDVGWSKNDEKIWALQPAAWVWNECVHVAAETNIPVALVGGVS